MAGVNKVMLIGHLGKDPEVRYLEGGVALARFSLATSEAYKDKNGNKVEQTEWHNIVMWRGLAEVAEKLLKKGMQVYLEGKLRTRAWNDKEGHKHYTTEVVADNVVLLGKKENNTNGSTNTESSAPPTGINDSAEDLPF